MRERHLSAPRDARERERAEALLAGILRPRAPRSLFEEHPAVFGEAASGELRVLWEGERALGGAAIVARRVATPHGEVRFGLVGSVATDPGARGQGIARAVLADCESALRERGCTVALLWADVPAFYERCGYSRTGTECLLVIRGGDPLPEGADTEPAVDAEYAAIEALRLREPSRSDRPREESFAHYASPGTRVFVHRDRRGVIDAYAALGRGADLRDVLHESAGSLHGILAIARRVLEDRGMPSLVLLTSAHRKDLLEYALVRGLEIRRGILGMGKVLDLSALADSLEVHLPAGVSARAAETGVRVERGPRSHDLGPGDVLHALLGSQGTRGPLDRLERALGIDRVETLPLAPSLGGFDSI